ncbi:hypothetical protein J2853_009707 [Streptosporangium lutulentum]|uniref:Uncharacterized protein n=1 Tax=Streptosporangium lutulentum TaxID=1461250 RepID=A0ABT9QUR2_9ACTN|nr:hypothetical protein [Streptosporangium lutulentum]MDP9850411.1 hypothetical protein [Streptosporangium lutulentum]
MRFDAHASALEIEFQARENQFSCQKWSFTSAMEVSQMKKMNKWVVGGA